MYVLLKQVVMSNTIIFHPIQLSSLSLRVILWDAKKSKNIAFRGEVRNIKEYLNIHAY